MEPVTGPTHAAVERPFRGRIDGRSVTAPTADPTIYEGGANATGNATHLGRFSKVTRDRVNATNGWTVGSFTMTAEGGEQLTGTYEGFVRIEVASGTLSWRLDARVSGGTGRFEHATGNFVFIASGTFSVSPDGIVTATYSETFDGTITY